MDYGFKTLNYDLLKENIFSLLFQIVNNKEVMNSHGCPTCSPNNLLIGLPVTDNNNIMIE